MHLAMSRFQYVAATEDGQQRKGRLDADNARHARHLLREQGLYPVKLHALRQHRQAFSSLSASELTAWTRELASLLQAGLPIDQALNAMLEQSQSAPLQSLSTDLIQSIRAGHSLSGAMQQQGPTFPDIFLALVAAGEEAGQLDTVLQRLADYQENRDKLRNKVMLALLYPAAITLVALGVIAGLLTYVVPQIVHVFQQTHQHLPWLTRALIVSSNFLRHWGLLLLLVLILASIGAWKTLQNPAKRLRWHAHLLQQPIIGALLRNLATARFASTLAMLTSSGVPLIKALQTATRVIDMLPIRAASQEIERMVTEGAALSRAIQTTRQFPPLLSHLIASGEASGQVSAMLNRAAQFYEQDLDTRTSLLMRIMEPLLVLIMGAIVLIIVLAIMLPIVQINHMAGAT